jgi:hypothetical protein
MTNGDKIRQMSNEELAKEIQHLIIYGDELDKYAMYPRVSCIKAYLDLEAE